MADHVFINGMEIVPMEDCPTPENPLLSDAYHMGTPMGRNTMILHPHHSGEEAEYLILVNKHGKQIKIVL